VDEQRDVTLPLARLANRVEETTNKSSRRKKMKKTTWHYLTDLMLFISIGGLIIIGIIMAFFTSSGPQVEESSKYFLNLHRHQWGDIHFYFSIVFVLFLVIHLILEWKWIKGKTRKLFGNLWFLAFAAAFLFIILFLSWCFSPKGPGAYEDYGKRRGKGFFQTQTKGQGIKEEKPPLQIKNKEENKKGEQKKHEEKRVGGRETKQGYGTIIITGQLSLKDIEEETGISSQTIADKLGLPAHISLNERLGRLRKRYLFNMQDVRDVVSSLLKEKKHEE
jgi:hypothetical protein